MTDKGKIVVIKRYFETKDLGKSYFSDIEQSVSQEIRGNSSMFLEYLLEKIISEHELELLIDNAMIKFPMLNSELLVFIRDELYRQGLIVNGYQEGLFNLLVPNEVWEVHKKSWFGWFNPKGKAMNFRKTEIKQGIEHTLNLHSSIWDEVEKKQREIVAKKVQEFLAKEKIEHKNNNDIDLSSLISTEHNISLEQIELLEKLKSQSKTSTEMIISKNQNFFFSSLENQDFLLQLLPILYEKGYFEILNQQLFPSLFEHHKNKIEVKIKEAHTLANLENPNYDKIIALLKNVSCTSIEESLNINTMIVSTKKRELIHCQVMNEDKLKDSFLTIIAHYNKIYENKNNYYTAINLFYVVTLFSMIFTNHQEIKDYDFNNIYKKIKKSILADIKEGGESKYYAMMSELEFRLLLGNKTVFADMNILLDELNPTTLLIETTLKQMRWFLEVGKKFGQVDKGLVFEFSKVVELLEGYEDGK